MNAEEQPAPDDAVPGTDDDHAPALEQIPGFAAPVPLDPPEPQETFEAEPAPDWGSARPMTCPLCGEVVVEGARFCERCGLPLFDSGLAESDPFLTVGPQEPAPPATACPSCGGRIAEDGYCEMCGEPALSERDHWEEAPATWVAGVSHRGIRHHRNEDAMSMAATGPDRSWAALVVCDGVSTASNSDVASLAAAGAALRAFEERGPEGIDPITGSITERMAAWSAQMDVAAQRANEAIVEASEDCHDNTSPPSCTFVAAVVDGPLVVTGWIGDSRAYWVPDEGKPEQLSVDDSWAQEMIAQGMSRTVAESAPQAHAITRWLGPDAPDVDAHTDTTLPGVEGWIVVCSDGLWNYCSGPEELRTVLRGVQESSGTDPIEVSRGLVAWANAQGGRDNITVALARIVPPSIEPSPPTHSKESHG